MGVKLDRQIDIINILLKSGRTSYENLSYALGVSVMTVRRDIDDLSLTYPIETFQGSGGGIEISKGYTIGGYIMNSSQLALIVEGLLLLNQNKNNPQIPQLISLLSPKKREG